MSAEERPAALVTPTDWRRPGVRLGLGGAQVLLLAALVVVGLGPILWLAKSAITPTADTIGHPMALFPHGSAWSNLREAWVEVDVGRYFWNTVVLAVGSWLVQIVVATTGGYALSVLRPSYAKVINALRLMTLFVPAVVLLVPLYIEIVHPPIVHHSLIDSYWAVWLPAGASAFNVIIVKRFFDNLPREIFEAARIDGAGPIQQFLHVTIPHLRRILLIVALVFTLFNFNNFDLIYLTTQGGPLDRTMTLPVKTYEVAFKGLQVGLSSAMAVIMLTLLALISICYLNYVRITSDSK